MTMHDIEYMQDDAPDIIYERFAKDNILYNSTMTPEEKMGYYRAVNDIVNYLIYCRDNKEN